MIITPIDSQHNLFAVSDFYPTDLLDKFLSIEHLRTDYTREDMQSDWPRRKLIATPGTIYNDIEMYVKTKIDEIGAEIGASFCACDTAFWVDNTGFWMEPHLDNEGVTVSMQIYLNDNKQELGTVFYNPDNSVRYSLPYTVNTGYIMINGPTQVHGMEVPVPQDTYRISSYTWFYPKV